MARYEAVSLAKRYRSKDAAELEKHFDFDRLVERFGRVRDFGEQQAEYRNWTFWTYARRAAKVFQPLGITIPRQLRSHRDNIYRRARYELERAVLLRDKPKSSHPLETPLSASAA